MRVLQRQGSHRDRVSVDTSQLWDVLSGRGGSDRVLQGLFAPRAVAVVGASRDEHKIGHIVLSNLLSAGFQGDIFPVNPHVGDIDGLTAYPDLTSLPLTPDLAIITVPAANVPGIVRECSRCDVPYAVVISSGFKEVGPKGAALEREIYDLAHDGNVRLLGPNCLGVMSTHASLNASFAASMPTKGNISFMTQSGALGTAILDWATGEGIGLSEMVSLGNKSDIDELDLVYAWTDSPETHVVAAYLESIADGSRFVEAATALTTRKPFIALKSGRSDAGARAVSSHTGSLAGSDRAYEAAFRKAGILRASTVEELFDLAVGFSNQPTPCSGGVVILTNAGGPAIMATDACERLNVPLASLGRASVDALRTALPTAAAVYNPVDVLGDADSERYRMAAKILVDDPAVGALLVILTPQAPTQPRRTAESVAAVTAGTGVTTLACFMGSGSVLEGRNRLRELQIPSYDFPERAVVTLAGMFEYSRHVRIDVTSEMSSEDPPASAIDAIMDASHAGRHFLSDNEVKIVADAYGLRTPPSGLAHDLSGAHALADSFGWPVVLKVSSPDILHKTDVGGIVTGIMDDAGLEIAFESILANTRRRMPGADVWGVTVQKMVTGGRELVVGVDRDPQFGPLLMFGLGGIYVEILKDVTFRLCPVSELEAREMIGEIRGFGLLRGARGQRPADLDAIIDVMVRVSRLVMDLGSVVEMDINPLIVKDVGEGAWATDIRIGIGG